MEDPLGEFEWNEAEADTSAELHQVVASIVAFGPRGEPSLIGTAFIVGAYDSCAMAITAAHNLHLGVRKAQNPHARHHPSALPEFLPEPEISTEVQKLRAIYQVGSRVEMCEVGFSTWDVRSDIAVLSLYPQRGSSEHLFRRELKIEAFAVPIVGQVIAAFGYADMATVERRKFRGGSERVILQRRLVARVGRVTRVHPDGHSLVRTPCVETSIPIFSGMSGGPVFLDPEAGKPISVCGLLSNDPEDSDLDKNDRSVPGNSIVALIPASVNIASGERRVSIPLVVAGRASNPAHDALDPSNHPIADWTSEE